MTPRLILLLLALTLAACGDEDVSGGSRRPGASGDLQAAGDSLCQAESFVAQGDVSAARTSFVGAHPFLHDGAAQLEKTDRALAKQLLQAKQQVEQAFAGPPEAEVIATRLAELRGVWEAAATSLGFPFLGCAL